MAEATKEPAKEPVKAAPKKDNTLKIVLIVVGVLFGLGVLGMILMTVLVGSVFHRVADNVKVDKNGSSVTVKSSDGQTTASYGADANIPQGFPSDVPVYEPSTIVYATKSSSDRFSLAAKTSKSTQDVTDYYRSELDKQGWTSKRESSYGDGTILTYTKDDRSLSVSISLQNNEKTDKTFINLAVQTVN